MGFANEILDAIEIMVKQVVEDNTTKIYTGVCKTISTSTCSLLINGKENTVKYYGGTPTVGTVYQVFIPFGNMSAAFIIVPGAGGQDPETGVSSVNGKTGAVVLTAGDVGALPNTTTIPTKTSQLDNDSGFVDATEASVAAPVQSVNAKTGAVVLTKSDIGLSNVDNVKQYSTSNQPPYPVTSVNNKTGAVVLDASDVGAVSTSDITTTLGTSPTKVPSEKAVSDALNAAGAGDMLKATYDPNGSVATAGGIPNYVETNGGKIDTIKVNGATQPITNKEVDIAVPTNNTQLTNGAGYITASEAPVTSVNGQTGDVTVTADIPDNLVKYTAVSDVQSVDGLNADTLEGHNAAYFATASGLSAPNTQVVSLNSGLSTANNNISALQTAMANKLDKSGGTMTGALIAKSGGDLTIAQVRNVIISTEEPSAEVGSNGDIWIRYTE